MAERLSILVIGVLYFKGVNIHCVIILLFCGNTLHCLETWHLHKLKQRYSNARAVNLIRILSLARGAIYTATVSIKKAAEKIESLSWRLYCILIGGLRFGVLSLYVFVSGVFHSFFLGHNSSVISDCGVNGEDQRLALNYHYTENIKRGCCY